MKKIKFGLAISVLGLGLSNPFPTNAESVVAHTINEIEPNNTQKLAQRFLIDSSYSKADEKYSEITGKLSDLSDEDWFVMKLPNERGTLINETPYGASVPKVTVFGEKTDGSFGDITYEDMSHLVGKDVYVQVKAYDKALDYKLRFLYGANPVSTDSHEPNDSLTSRKEFTPITENTYVNSKWNTDYDWMDTFGINGQTSKGVLSFEVVYPDDEFEYWKTNNLDHYLTYTLYAERKDGTVSRIWGKAQTGMPNKVFTHSLNVDNTNFTGSYYLELGSNYKVNKNYKVKINFAEATEPSPTPTPTPTEPTNPSPTPTPTPTEPTNPSPTPTQPTQPANTVERLSGATRFETNLSVTAKIPNQSLDSVIIANGFNYPDALTGGVLNNSLNGAILLVENNNNTINNVIKEAKRLLKSNGQIYVLGGESAVSNEVVNKLKANTNYKVNRVSGLERIDTAIEIAKLANAKPTEIFLTYGFEFADALSVVPYASKIKAPILLNGKGNLDQRVANYIKNSGIKKVTIIGGNNAISPQVEQSLKGMNVTVERVSGDTRFTTALAIAKKYYPSTQKVAIAYGRSFADALSGSRLAYEKDLPILLVEKDSIQNDVKSFVANSNEFYILGGEQAVSSNVANQFK